jgi:outer membrane protein OmpA-like peptidoglycan-associated protein
MAEDKIFLEADLDDEPPVAAFPIKTVAIAGVAALAVMFGGLLLLRQGPNLNATTTGSAAEPAASRAPAESTSSVAPPHPVPSPAAVAQPNQPKRALKSAASPGSQAERLGVKTAAGDMGGVSARVLFESNSAKVSVTGARKLQALASHFSRGGTVTVEGHSDVSGPPDYNLQLSQQRAQQVAKLLQANGLDESVKVVVRGLGEARPRAADTRTGRRLNRRVEVSYSKQL